MAEEELTHRIIQAPMRGASLEGEVGRLLRIELLLEQLVRLVTGNAMDPSAPPGVVQRLDKHHDFITDILTRVGIIEAARKTTTEKIFERAWDVIQLVGAAVLGAWISKGAPH